MRTEGHRIKHNLIPAFGEKLIREMKREEMQDFLDRLAKNSGQSLVDHMWFCLRSIFKFAVSERVLDRNPAEALHTPQHCKESGERKVLELEDSRKCSRS